MIYNLPPLPEPYGQIGFHDVYTADQMRAHAQAALDALAAPIVSADLIAGALYDLMGHLTSRDETLHLGATEWATPAVDALVAFAEKRGLSLNNPAIEDWFTRLAAPNVPSGEPVAYASGRTLHWHAGRGVTDAQLYATPQPAPAVRQCALWVVDAYNSKRPDYLLRSIQKLTRALDAAPAAPRDAHG